MIAIRLLLFVGLNAFMFTGFYVWLAGRRWAFLDAVLGAFLLVLTQIFLVGMLLAAVGQLAPLKAVAVNFVLSVALWVRVARFGLDVAKKTVLTCRSAWRGFSWFGRLLLIMVVAVFGWSLWYTGLAPEVGWDANMYHIPIAALRNQEGNLTWLRSGWSYIEGYPETGEMLMLWPLQLLGRQNFADAVQWPFWVCGMLAVISVARKMGAGLEHGLTGSLVWVFAPVVMLQAQTAHVDLMVAALFLIGLNFAYRRPVSPFSVSLTGLAAMLIAGMKLSGATLVVLLAFLAIWGIARAPNRRPLVWAFLVVWIGFGLVNSYWYLANWQQTNNLFWPINVSLGPLKMKGSFNLAEYEQTYTPGSLANQPAWLRPWLVWLERDSNYAADAKLTGFGPLWLILGIPGIVAWAILDRKGWPLILSALVLLLVESLSWHARYMAFLPGLGGIALAVVLTRFGTGVSVLVRVLLLASALFSCVVAYNPYRPGYVGIPETYRSAAYSGWMPLSGAYRWLDANTRAPAKVVYGGPVAFLAPLWGEDLRHTVEYVKPAQSVDWEKAVLDSGAEWVFAVIDSREDQLLAKSPGFTLVLEDKRPTYLKNLQTHVYHVVRAKDTQ
jgi:hypothetical protein